MPRKPVTPDVDLAAFNEFTYEGKKFFVKRKMKIGRFLRSLNTSPIDALEVALEEDSFERFLDLEMDMDDLKEFLELLSNVLAGTDAGN